MLYASKLKKGEGPWEYGSRNRMSTHRKHDVQGDSTLTSLEVCSLDGESPIGDNWNVDYLGGTGNKGRVRTYCARSAGWAKRTLGGDGEIRDVWNALKLY